MVYKILRLKFLFRKFLSMSHAYDVIYGRLKEGGRKHTLELLSQNTLKVSVFLALKDVNK